MSLGAHLLELRRRLMWSSLAIVIGCVVGWFLSEPLWLLLSQPVITAAVDEDRLATVNFTTITGAFDLRLQLALVAGVVLTCPVWLYQVFRFFLPGLTGRETRYVMGFLGAAIPLFLAGCAAGWSVLPRVVQVMMSFASPGTATYLTASDYLSFVLKLVLATGVAFVLPVVLVFLNFAGLLAGRSILRAWQPAVVVIALFAAIATPSADVLSMFILALPMVSLYFAAVGIAILHDRGVARRIDALGIATERPGRMVAS